MRSRARSGERGWSGHHGSERGVWLGSWPALVAVPDSRVRTETIGPLVEETRTATLVLPGLLEWPEPDRGRPGPSMTADRATGAIRAKNHWLHTTNWDLVVFDEYQPRRNSWDAIPNGHTGRRQ
jgi:hypothetical protein